MKSQLKILIIVFFTLSMLSCEKEYPEIKSNIVFQYHYENYAWGTSYGGFLIDSTGAVYCYDKFEIWVPNIYESQISESDINIDLSQINTPCFILEKDELLEKIRLIEKAAEGDLTEEEHVMYDAGKVSYFCFVPDSEIGMYKRVLLKQWGDFQIENKSNAAKELSNWLFSLQELVYTSN